MKGRGRKGRRERTSLPAVIKDELKDVEATEGGTATLRCELSKSAAVEWKKGPKALRQSGKYRMKQEGTSAELLIRDLDLKDAGDYTCIVGDQKTTAALSVNGKTSEVNCEIVKCPSLISLSLACFFLYIRLHGKKKTTPKLTVMMLFPSLDRPSPFLQYDLYPQLSEVN
uniref:Ig-like domain-containing protein n=1 Tax=Crocodylus porosus TaxID=8502 RepID=A0A7M4E2A6_CROPO